MRARLLTITVCAALAAMLIASPSRAEEKPAQVSNAPGFSNATGMANTASMDIKIETYRYQSEDNRDPFLSLAQQQRGGPVIAGGDKPETEKVQTDYDLSQLKVIAVMDDGTKRYAMVGLPNRKFFTLYEGSPIGLHDGVIIRIVPGDVVVKEKVGGQEVSKTTRKAGIVVREKITNYKRQVEIVDTEIQLRPEGIK